MEGACSMDRERRGVNTVLVGGKLRKRNHLEYSGVDGRITLTLRLPN
jgi:hypothetical protein